MSTIRRTAGQTAALLIMTAIIAAVVLYRAGYYDISFIKRKAAEVTEALGGESESGTAESETPPDLDSDDLNSGDNLSSITSPGAINKDSNGTNSANGIVGETTSAQGQETAPAPVSRYTAFDSSLESAAALKAAGWELSDAAYNAQLHKIAKKPLAVNPANVYTLRDEKVSGRVWDEKSRDYIEVSETQPRPVIKLYMGYIFMDDGETLALLDDNGAVVMINFDDMQFAYERDAYDRPLFIYRGVYYYITPDYNMPVSYYDPQFGPPLKYDSPAGYNAPGQNLYLYYEERTVEYVANEVEIIRKRLQHDIEIEPIIEEETVRLWGYVYPNGEIAIPAQYYYAYNFGPNGLAVVADRDRVASLITRNGRVAVNPHGRVLYLKERNRRPAILGYYLPETDSVRELGMFFFDHGLIRMRKQLIDYYERDMIVSDSDVLITAAGAVFDIPGGYNLVSYSDGVLLLEKDGRYGCLDYTGRWIAQPIYTYAVPFAEGLCAIGFSDGKKGMIDTSGNVVLPFVYDYVSAPSCGRIAVYEDANGWCVYEKLA